MARLISLFIIISLNFFNRKDIKGSYTKKEQTIEISEKNDSIISECTLDNNIKVSIININSKKIQLFTSGNSTSENTVINLNELNFINNEVSSIDIECLGNSFSIKFSERLGNNYFNTYHVFSFNEITKNFTWSKIYKTEITRNGFSLSGVSINNNDKLEEYNGNENLNLELFSIYSFEGFQESKKPNLDAYYETIKSKKDSDEELALIGNEFVISYIIDNIPLEESNLEKFNEIAEYLNQSNLNNEARFLLEKIKKNLQKN